jgi:hypothetical protein
MTTIETTGADMIWIEDKLFVVIWYIVRLLVLRTQGIEKTVEFSHAYETNVADFHYCIWFPWTWVPQGMSTRRKRKSQLFAKVVVFGHRHCEGRKNFSMPVGRSVIRVKTRWQNNLNIYPEWKPN